MTWNVAHASGVLAMCQALSQNNLWEVTSISPFNRLVK